MDPHHIKNVLITEEQLHARTKALAQEMRQDCSTPGFVLVGILRGSFMFLADLVRELHWAGAQPRMDFMTLESYGGGTTSGGVPRITKDVHLDMEDSEVVLVDDILDSGRTLTFAKKHLLNKGARSVKTCVLLDKPSRRVANISADHVGFTIEDKFVVGYGLDYDSHYRQLPFISLVTFTPEVATTKK